MSSPSITLRGRYEIGGAALFGPLEIVAPAGKWTCLLGPSGVGKSTLLRVLAGLEHAGEFSGDILTSDGQPIVGRVGLMAQTDLLMPWLSAVDNTVLGARLRSEKPDMDRAHTLLERVGLGGHINKKPAELSGGMRQRVALARTLMEDRPVVFLDEPFSALDASTRASMQELASELLADKTVFLITHDPAEAIRMGHRVIVMTAAEAQIWPVPDTQPLRDLYTADTVSHQAALMAHLRGLK